MLDSVDAKDGSVAAAGSVDGVSDEMGDGSVAAESGLVAGIVVAASSGGSFFG